MRLICSMTAAAMVLVGPFAAPVVAEEKLPGFKLEERPLMGPPPKPKSRGMKQEYGKKCRTQQGTCGLEKEDVLDRDCACPERDSPRGKVVK
jgi:hypothetical protein